MKARYHPWVAPLVAGAIAALSAGDVVAQSWDGSSDNSWATAANWTPGSVPNAPNATATIGAIATGQTTIGLRGTRTVGTLNFQGAQDFTINNGSGGTRDLRFDVSTGSAAINLSGSTTSQLASTVRAVLYDNTTITQNSSGVFTIAGVIAESGGARSLTHNGTGTTVLSGANTYTGATTLNGGVLSVSNLANGGAASNIGDSTSAAANLVFNGGTLRYTGTGSTTDRSFTVGTGGATFEATGSGAVNFNQTGTLAYSGTSARTITLTGTSTAANNISADIGDGTGGATSLVKDGTGTWRISGDNTYGGTATVNNGLLEMNSNTINGAVPETASLVVGDGSGAALSAIARNLQEGQVGNNSTVTVNSDGWFDINAAAYVNKGGDTFWKEETVGQVNLTGGRITTGATGSLNINAANAGATIASFSSSQTALIDATGGQVALNANRTISVENGSQTTDLEVRGAIANSVTGTGSNGVTKTGAGQLSFTGTEANSYTGPTTVNGGTLELAKSNNVTSIAGSAITVNSGGTLLLSASEQINNAANLTMNSGTLATSDINGIETLGTLTLTGNSVIDLGNAAYLLKFANSSAMSWSGTLTIYGWLTTPATSGTQNQIYFGNNAAGLTNAQLAMVSFNGFGPGAMLLSSGELVPVAVPEAGTVAAAALLVLAVAWRERRRLAGLIRHQSAA